MDKHLLDKLIGIRRQLHLHPELGFQEFNTSSLVRQELGGIGISLRNGGCYRCYWQYYQRQRPGSNFACRHGCIAHSRRNRTDLELHTGTGDARL